MKRVGHLEIRRDDGNRRGNLLEVVLDETTSLGDGESGDRLLSETGILVAPTARRVHAQSFGTICGGDCVKAEVGLESDSGKEAKISKKSIRRRKSSDRETHHTAPHAPAIDLVALAHGVLRIKRSAHSALLLV